MSGLLLVLLSGLTMFGAISLGDGAEETETAATDDMPEATEPAEGGSNPLDVAMEDEAAEETPATEPEEVPTENTDGGTEGEDTLAGDTSENDTIAGSESDDTIDGGAGDDIVGGGLGADTLYGGAGADSVTGGEGDDVLYGGASEGGDDGAEDTLDGGAGADRIFLEDTDVATGGEGADTFVRAATLTTRALVTDFDASEDLVVIEHESDEPPTLVTQDIASDGVILRFSDGSSVELAGLTAAIDETLISYVDIRG